MPILEEIRNLIRSGDINQITAKALGTNREDWNEAFLEAISTRRLNVIRHLLDLTTDRVQHWNMIAAYNYRAFREAASQGHLDVVDLLIDRADQNQRQKMIAVYHYEAFRVAASQGHLDVVDLLIDRADQNQRQKMIAVYNYEAFRVVASKGHLDVVNLLINLTDQNQRQEMIAADGYRAFREAASKGHLDVVDLLIDRADPDQRQEMIIDRADPDQRQEMINEILNLDQIRSKEKNKLLIYLYVCHGGLMNSAFDEAQKNQIEKFSELRKNLIDSFSANSRLQQNDMTAEAAANYVIATLLTGNNLSQQGEFFQTESLSYEQTLPEGVVATIGQFLQPINLKRLPNDWREIAYNGMRGFFTREQKNRRESEKKNHISVERKYTKEYDKEYFDNKPAEEQDDRNVELNQQPWIEKQDEKYQQQWIISESKHNIAESKIDSTIDDVGQKIPNRADLRNARSQYFENLSSKNSEEQKQKKLEQDESKQIKPNESTRVSDNQRLARTLSKTK